MVVVPRGGDFQGIAIDIKYVDFTGVQDIPFVYPKAECYIVPPYKHVMYATVYSPSTTVDVYAIKGKRKKQRTLCQITTSPSF